MRKLLNIVVLTGILASIAGPALARPERFCRGLERIFGDREVLDAASDEQIDIWVANYNKHC